jgi:CHAT domain-containing protein
MAFLAAGADQVIATVGPVSREATERLTDRLYHADTTDLARALAQIQAAGDDDDLLGFAAFGHATCNPSSP